MNATKLMSARGGHLARSAVSLLVLAAGLSGTAALAASPDAGQLLNEQGQHPVQLPQRLPQDKLTAPEAPVALPGERQIVVHSFRFTGTDGIVTEAELQAVVAEHVGKTMTFGQLQAAADQVTAYLRQKGWPLARAYLPRQDVTEGAIEIAILQGHVEKEGATIAAGDTRLRKWLIKDMVDGALPSDQRSPNQNELERGVLLLNDLPGISARSTLERGNEPETTRLIIETTEGPWVTGGVSADNYGSRYTGARREVGNASLNDPLGIGDQVTVSATHAEGLLTDQVGYSLPLGARGLRFAASYSRMLYDVGKENGGLDAKGGAQTADAKLTYPIIRTRQNSLSVGLDYTYKELIDHVGGVTTTRRRLDDVSASLTANLFDDFAGGGLTTSTLTGIEGHLDRGGNRSDQATDWTTANSDGTFQKATLTIARLQHLTEQISMFSAVNGQYASKNLDSSEKIILGGPAAIRAYPVGEASGDEGWIGNLEVRYDVPADIKIGNLQLVTFYDVGGVKLDRDLWTGAVNTSTTKNGYMLSGAGVGVNLAMSGIYAIRASWAHAIGVNGGRSVNGANTDGLDHNNAGWLQAEIDF